MPPPPPPMESLSIDSEALSLPRGPVKQLPKVVDPRTDLLQSIRGGAVLKKVNVDDRKNEPSNEVGSDALVNALLEKLQERRYKVGNSESEDEDDDEVECDSDDWDD